MKNKSNPENKVTAKVQKSVRAGNKYDTAEDEMENVCTAFKDLKRMIAWGKTFGEGRTGRKMYAFRKDPRG